MTAKLRELVQILKDCDDENADGECIACRLFQEMFCEPVLDQSVEISLKCTKKNTFGMTKTE